MKKAKICFISVYAYGLFKKESGVNFGGAEVQMYQLGKELEKDPAFEISFISYYSQKVETETIDGIKMRVVYPLLGKIRAVGALTKRLVLLKKLWEADADVYLQRAAGIETGIICFFCKVFRRKFIYMSASLMDIDGRYVRENGLAGKVFAYGLRNADQIIVQNEEHKKILREKLGKGSLVIKNSFPILENKANGTREFVFWLSSSQKLKHPEIFLRMAESFPREKFIMVMPKLDMMFWNDIRQRAEKLNNLEFIEKVPFEKIRKYFEEAKIFLNTSDFEGFPNTFVQSAIAGTPIVSLNVNPDNFLNAYDCGYCAEGDERKMEEMIAKLLNDRNDWQKKSINAVRYAKKNHDIKSNIEKIKKIVQEVAKK